MTDVEYVWRGPFTNDEVNDLHADAFEHRRYSSEEWDWSGLCHAHSLGWVTARKAGVLVGFVNVPWDGFVHAWIQDEMVSTEARRKGIGIGLIHAARDAARDAGCEWLHVDFDEHLESFYIESVGFTPARAGLMDLTTPS